jgi:CPA2 family monovalent cation:H+ antiporter-2
MQDIPASTFFNYFVFFLIPFLLGLIVSKNKTSLIIAYILGGIILNNLLGNYISKPVINNLAYFGILLLLFTVGLEIKFDKIINLRKYIILGGFLQVTVSIVFISLLSLFFNFNLLQSFLIGMALSSSSTGLVAKIIQDRGEENSFLGEMAIGVLMFQDLAFIPFMVFFTSLTGLSLSAWEMTKKISLDMFTSFVILFSVYFFGRRFVPIIFDKVARLSRELMNLLIILFIFFASFVSTLFGVPALVSIFIAGILVAQTNEHYHIFSQLRPIRDLLAIVFFIYIGLNINLSQILVYFPQILLFTCLLLAVKAFIILFIFILFKFNSKMAFYLALYLCQIDEDAFILMSLAYLNKLFTYQQYLFIISSVLFSLLVTPLIINGKEKIYFLLRNRLIKKYLSFLDSWLYKLDSNLSPIDVLNIKNHIILCGFGRVGSYIGRALLSANIPYVAIDYNFNIVEKAKKEGVNIIYGDPTDINILDYAQADEAIVIVITLPDIYSQEAVIMNAKKLNPKIIIFSRVHRQQNQKKTA